MLTPEHQGALALTGLTSGPFPAQGGVCFSLSLCTLPMLSLKEINQPINQSINQIFKTKTITRGP